MPSLKPYPPPLIIPPLASNHTHTLILLHGRGSNSDRFGPELLESANLPAQLPTVKFVFPTASKRRSTVLKKTPINQWFDNYSLEDPNQRTDLQVDGLCQTAAFLRELVENEATLLGPGDPFEESCGQNIEGLDALNHVRDILDLSALAALDLDPAMTFPPEKEKLVASYLHAPVFIGHGALDEKVSVSLGKGLAGFLSTTLHMDVTWKSYEDLGHWYGVPDEINDIVQFLQEKVGVPVHH